MSVNPFTKAVKPQHFLRLALTGPSGSGKTFTALRLAHGLGTKIAVVDTEHGSAALYAPQFAFDVLTLETFAPQDYLAALDAAAAHGYEVLILDSLSHAWAGKGGILDMQAAAASADHWGNDRLAWRAVAPEHSRLMDAILRAPLHVIATMRSRVEYVVESDERGKTVIRKVGLKPIQQDSVDFEFDVVGDLDQTHTLTITKTHCPVLSRAVFAEPGEDLAQILRSWLEEGVEPRVGETEIKQLGGWLKAHPMSIPELMAIINSTLQTSYANPRQMTRAQWAQVMTVLEGWPGEAPAVSS
ncbi:MAG: AAA family ATPase [Sulfobacillus thermosulfidooxidans]|uniref:AAA family ATPase n=1 Tax=Sulfobacillus thermosulfidooxidans TaxID=28034 RepID=A0A2T2WR63_SULTH|nr:MAG: AAA family ATPase [Sulfobacillus thermosulfidooxidans]